MKGIVVGIFLLLLCGCSSVTVMEKSIKVKGPIKKTYQNAEQNIVLSTKYEAFQKGWDADGYYVIATTENNTGEIVEVKKNFYNSGDNLIKSEKYNNSGKLEESTTLTWKGGIVAEEVFVKNGKELKTVHSTEGEIKNVIKSSKNAQGKLEWEDEYKYDNKGNIVEEVYRDGRKKINGWKKYSDEYDENDNIIVKQITSNDGSKAVESYSYKYDFDNRIINRVLSNEKNEQKYREEYKYDDSGKIILIVKYNEYDEEIEKVRYTPRGEVAEEVAKGAEENVALWREYRYDETGNILEEKLLNQSGDVDYTVVYSY